MTSAGSSFPDEGRSVTMRVLIVGAGGQGAPCASILARDSDVSSITLGDIDLDLANRVKGRVGSDKIAHIIVYAILSAWFAIIVVRSSSLWWIFISLVGFGILMEVFQDLTGYRSLELADAIANSVGVCLGLLCRFTRLRQWLIRLDLQLAVSR